MKAIDQRNADRNKNDPEYDGHQDADQQHPSIIFFFDRKGREDQDKNEDVVNTQAPLHQVGT